MSKLNKVVYADDFFMSIAILILQVLWIHAQQLSVSMN